MLWGGGGGFGASSGGIAVDVRCRTTPSSVTSLTKKSLYLEVGMVGNRHHSSIVPLLEDTGESGEICMHKARDAHLLLALHVVRRCVFDFLESLTACCISQRYRGNISQRYRGNTRNAGARPRAVTAVRASNNSM